MNKCEELLFEPHHIVANSDIDGILSTYLKCRVDGKSDIIGFSNSWDLIDCCGGLQLTKENTLYIDIFMGNPQIKSIDQHIVFSSARHRLDYGSTDLKLNPNIDKGIYFTNYSDKYPYSTFLYLIALYEGQGVELDFLYDSFSNTDVMNFENLNWMDIAVRADNCADNYWRYTTNAARWNDYLVGLSCGGRVTQMFLQYIVDMGAAAVCTERKERTEKFLRDNFKGCGKDGGFKDFFSSETRNLDVRKINPYFLSMNYYLQGMFGKIWTNCPTIPEEFVSKSQICGQKVFVGQNGTDFEVPKNAISWAYICGPYSRYEQLSYSYRKVL